MAFRTWLVALARPNIFQRSFKLCILQLIDPTFWVRILQEPIKRLALQLLLQLHHVRQVANVSGRLRQELGKVRFIPLEGRNNSVCCGIVEVIRLGYYRAGHSCQHRVDKVGHDLREGQN